MRCARIPAYQARSVAYHVAPTASEAHGRGAPTRSASALVAQRAKKKNNNNAAQEAAQANGGSAAPEAAEAADKAPEEEQALAPAGAGALEQPQPAKAAAAPGPPQARQGLAAWESCGMPLCFEMRLRFVSSAAYAWSSRSS